MKLKRESKRERTEKEKKSSHLRFPKVTTERVSLPALSKELNGAWGGRGTQIANTKELGRQKSEFCSKWQKLTRYATERTL